MCQESPQIAFSLYSVKQHLSLKPELVVSILLVSLPWGPLTLSSGPLDINMDYGDSKSGTHGFTASVLTMESSFPAHNSLLFILYFIMESRINVTVLMESLQFKISEFVSL